MVKSTLMLYTLITYFEVQILVCFAPNLELHRLILLHYRAILLHYQLLRNLYYREILELHYISMLHYRGLLHYHVPTGGHHVIGPSTVITLAAIWFHGYQQKSFVQHMMDTNCFPKYERAVGEYDGTPHMQHAL